MATSLAAIIVDDIYHSLVFRVFTTLHVLVGHNDTFKIIFVFNPLNFVDIANPTEKVIYGVAKIWLAGIQLGVQL